MDSGVQSVTTTLTTVMLKLSAVCWDITLENRTSVKSLLTFLDTCEKD